MDQETLERVSDDSWFSWSKAVLMEMERHSKCLEKHDQRMASLERKIDVLIVKCGAFGLLGGVASVAVMMGVAWLTKN